MSNETTANPPIKKFRVGQISANIWERKNDNGTFHNVTLERGYKDEAGEYKSTNGFSLQDMTALKVVVGMAEKHLTDLVIQQHS